MYNQDYENGPNWKKFVTIKAEALAKIQQVRIVKEEFYAKQTSSGNIKKRRAIKRTILKFIPFTKKLELKEQIITTSHFDQTAIQNDDRHFTTKHTVLNYNIEELKEQERIALDKYMTNTTHELGRT